jgi:glycosyltransferase involved in cell wall biosynthesis
MKKIVFLTKGEDAPSFRYRLKPLIESLESKGHKCHIVLVDSSNYIWRIWQHYKLLKSASAIICHKLLLPRVEVNLLNYLNNHLFLDVDDAIFLKEPKWVGHKRPRSKIRESKFKYIASTCKFNITGNQHLKNKIESLGGKAIILPTGTEANTYTNMEDKGSSLCRIVWIGLPTNLRYLEMIHSVFKTLQEKYPTLRLRIICSKFPDWEDVTMEKIFWSKYIEYQTLAESDIGIMPLDDSEYSKGKCAFKLLQYMAAGLPCVASPVGANKEVIDNGETGFLANTEKEWIDTLSLLIENKEMRKTMGNKGREVSATEYNQENIARRYADFIIKNSHP